MGGNAHLQAEQDTKPWLFRERAGTFHELLDERYVQLAIGLGEPRFVDEASKERGSRHAEARHDVGEMQGVNRRNSRLRRVLRSGVAQSDQSLARPDLPPQGRGAHGECMVPAPAPALEVRNLHFTFAGVPRAWHGGRRSITAFFDNLSIFFPVGERFFITAVRAHLGAVEDDQLRRDVRMFCGQEGVHGREHDRYNEMLAEQGYPVEVMERRVKRLLEVTSKILSVRQQLGVTCALEHFTALLARGVLGDERLLEGADPRMSALWRWHSVEEYEHRAVAYDVYRAAGGTYFERCWTMVLASLIFWAKIYEQQIRMMHHDGMLFSGREWLALFRYLFVDPGGLRKLALPYLAYYKRGFHPNDDESEALVEGPLRELADSAYVEGFKAA